MDLVSLFRSRGFLQICTAFARLLFQGGFYSRAASIPGRLLSQGGFYPRAASIPGRLLFRGGFYSRAASIPGRLPFQGGFYSRAASIQGRLLFKGGFLGVVFTPFAVHSRITFIVSSRYQFSIFFLFEGLLGVISFFDFVNFFFFTFCIRKLYRSSENEIEKWWFLAKFL